MDKENINTLVFDHLNVNYINNNFLPKSIKSGFMFVINGPEPELGFWKKEEDSWKWTYKNGIKNFYKFYGIEPKYLNNKKWAFAGLSPILVFSCKNIDYKIIFLDTNTNTIICQHSLEHMLPEIVISDLKNHVSTLKITEANTYFKQFNFNPEQIKIILNSLISEITSKSNIIKTTLGAGTWIYAGKSPKTSLPSWFFKLEQPNYYIDAYNWTEGDEPKFNDTEQVWLSSNDVFKEFKSSSLPSFITSFLIDKKIIEGSSYENIVIENKNKDIKAENIKLSLYERAIKGEFKQLQALNKKNKTSDQIIKDSEFIEDKELEYKAIEFNQNNKTFQLSFEEVEAELVRLCAKNLFDNTLFVRQAENTSEKFFQSETFDINSLYMEYENIFKNKNKDIIFSLFNIEEEKKVINFIFSCENFDTSPLIYEKLILSIKNPKKTSYFKINEQNYMLERILNNFFIIIIKKEAFTISEKFTYGKLVEEFRADYKRYYK